MIGNDTLKAIQDLHQLKLDGIITEVEFERSKQRLLFGRQEANGQPASMATGALPAAEDHIAWITLPLRRYADFTGRSGRKEFWMFQIIYAALAVIGVVFVGGTAEPYGEFSPFGNVVLGLIVLALLGLIVPLLAVEARRFHDQERSGWFVLLNLIPYIGVFIVFGMMLIDGTRGDNRFGPDPTE